MPVAIPGRVVQRDKNGCSFPRAINGRPEELAPVPRTAGKFKWPQVAQFR